MKEKIIDITGIGLSTILTITQTNEIFQLISLILTILTTVVTLAYQIYKWSKKAMSDGKLEPEELKELADILEENNKEI